MEKLSQKIHVLTLVIKRPKDIPLVRSKAKLLATLGGFSRTRRVKIALMASEMARFLLKQTKGGRVIFYIICASINGWDSPGLPGLMVHFWGEICPRSFDSHSPIHQLIQGIKNIADRLEIKKFNQDRSFELEVMLFGDEPDCGSLLKGQEQIRQQVFKDLQESYIENLRAKHQEVLSLLRTISLKNKELDKVNAELLELSKDMESLVHERTIVEFALKIADKVRNPATIIGGLARILLKKLPENSSERDKIKAIYLEAQKLEAIVKDFEGLAREQERFFTKVVLQDLVKEILEAWQPNFEKKGIRVEFKAPENPVRIRGNPRTLKVAVLHLLKNAADASPNGASIKVEIKKIEGRPAIEIEDQGPGISREVKAKLFKELVTTKPSGTGVGLIMVHHIMKEHQGQIEIDSIPGHGTRVTLLFPLRWKEKDI